jgi:hypothetical protein
MSERSKAVNLSYALQDAEAARHVGGDRNAADAALKTLIDNAAG